MPSTEFKDLGYNFKIDAVDSIPTELRNEFKDELSETDNDPNLNGLILNYLRILWKLLLLNFQENLL